MHNKKDDIRYGFAILYALFNEKKCHYKRVKERLNIEYSSHKSELNEFERYLYIGRLDRLSALIAAIDVTLEEGIHKLYEEIEQIWNYTRLFSC